MSDALSHAPRGMPVRTRSPDFSAAPWCSGTGLALVCGDQRWDYDRLGVEVAARARLLRDQGLAAGELVLAPDAPVLDLLLMQHALARLGAALFPYRAGLDREARADLARLAAVEWHWDPLGARLERLGPGPGTPPARPPALLIRTSGSSGGRIKAAMLGADAVLASALGCNHSLGLGGGDRWLCCLRTSHVGGLAIAYRCALAGATLVLHQGFAVEQVAHDLDAHAITHLSLVPPMLARLLDHGVRPPASLRVVMVGGQALSPALAARALEAGWPLHVTYGMTETGSQIATSARLHAAPSPGRIGPLLPGCAARGGKAEAPARLWLRGPVLMQGYANPDRRPGEGLRDGWFETSDLGWVADAGALWVQGRADDLRVIAGNNVSLARVEAVLAGAPGVTALAVVALEDPVWGHRLVAVYSGEASADELAVWCAGPLSGSERPRSWLRVAALPLLDSGKYDRVAIGSLARTGAG
ncbi:AMP-dependent synthetase [Marichromatium sp. AB32]|nr:AMP-dependent synthetase [Marichromatium sp. AB32]